MSIGDPKPWIAVLTILVACGSSDDKPSDGPEEQTGGYSSGAGGDDSSASGGENQPAAGAPSGGVSSSNGGTHASSGGRSSGGSSSPGGRGGSPTNTGGSVAAEDDLCAGLVQDQKPHPMTTLSKPAVGAAVTDAEFGTVLRRITAVKAPSDGSDPVIKPMYSTISAWNADESLLLLYHVGSGHELYDGRTYAFIRSLEIEPADLEQVYWHTSDPDVFFYVEGQDFVRYHVKEDKAEVLTTFDFCSGDVSGGSDPMFTSFDSKRIGLGCDNQGFIYDIESNTVLAKSEIDESPAQVAPSGTLAYFGDSGRVTDASLKVLRTLDLAEPEGHADLGRLPTGEDTWNGVVFDDGPAGNDDIGSLVTFNLTTGKSKVIIGPKTGWPYPPTTHISAMAYRRPGWTFVSTFGEHSGKNALDMELLLANTVTGAVCRAGRHRSWGKENTKLSDGYWAEAHAVPSPSGTRIAFASDWGNGTSVDTYVVELPSYSP